MNSSQRTAERKHLSEAIHQLSQPLSVLECGLELSLLHDRTAAEFRKREKILLDAANEMHQRLVELRERLAGNPAQEEPFDILPNRAADSLLS